jgi:acyl-homoserine-lactone acylase
MKKLCAAVTLSCLVFAIGFAQTHPDTTVIDPSQIDIVRDVYGVPHIFARTDSEVAYGLAWAHAEDDFNTLQKTVLASKAMLGQLSGREGATVDYFVHFLQIRNLVDSLYESAISPAYKEVLQGYCEGMNAYARTHPKEILVKKSFPVSPKDVIAYSILQLAIGCDADIAIKKIYNKTIPLADPVFFRKDAEGSNAFAFNSKITKDGNVYLAINTHHPLEGQVAWYEAHLSSEEGWNIVGTLFPGAPVIFTGFNENLGWTHTVNHPDKLDVYQLEMHPVNNLQYRVDDTWYTLEETTIKLKAKVPGFNAHVKRKVYKSIYGPTMVTDKGVFSIRTAALMDIRALEQWFRMNKARNFSEFRSALKMEAVPAYNLVYGDRFDTIFYLSNGKLPFRDPAFNWQSTLPGNTFRTLWTTIHPIEDLPQVLNPSSGYLYNTNHSPFNATAAADNINAASYDPTMGYETHNNNRSLRVMELMEELAGNDSDSKISYEEFKRIKYDLQLPQKLAFPVDIDALFLLEEKNYPEVAELITILKRWDRKGTTDSKGAALFGVFFYYVAAKYQADESFRLMTPSMCAEALLYVKEYLMTNFGSTDITLGEYQRLERGNWSIPLPGLPDVLAAMYATPTENGRVKGTVGECYIGLAKFTPSGPEIETVNAFGASNRKDSPHYNDQMELFQQQKTKKMTLNRQRVYKEAKSIYHPEILSRLPATARLTRGRR